MAHVAKGNTLRFGDPEAAIPEYNLALQFDPNNPNTYAVKGANLTVAGRAREAVSALQIALRLSPKDPLAYNWHFNLCHAYTHLNEFDAALAECKLSIDLNPIWWYPYSDLASIYGTTGQIDKARETVATLLGIRPDFTVQGYKKLGYFVSKVPQFRREFDDIVEGLRKAGVPEE